MFNALSIGVVVKFRGPVAVMTFDANRLVVDFPADRQGPPVVRIVFVAASRPVTCFTLDPPKFRGDLFTYKSLGFAIAGGVAFQAIRVVAHSTKTGKRVGMGVLFPFPEILKVTQTALAVADVIGRFAGGNVNAAGPKRTVGTKNGQRNPPRRDKACRDDTICRPVFAHDLYMTIS